MPKIVVKRKAEVYKEFPIRPFQSRIAIGSEGDNDLIIADKKVSMHHLIIEKEGTSYFIRDNKSAFGTYVNGNRIAERLPISSGDEIAIGEHTLIFENVLFEKSVLTQDPLEFSEPEIESDPVIAQPVLTPVTETAGHEMESEEVITLEKEEIEEIKTPPRPIISKIPTEGLTPHYLLAINGPYLGKKYRLNFGMTKIGRDQTFNDIVIRETSKGEVDTSISRRHATIILESGKYYIMDKRSKTRTRINQKQLNEEDVMQLFPNDEIEIVSDQKSTIFRFVPESLMDFSYPKQAGLWWDRNSYWAIQVLSAIASILLIALIVNLWGKASLYGQKPSPFQINEQFFISDPSMQSISIQPADVTSNMPSLAPATADLNGDGFLDVIYLDKRGNLNVINGKLRKPLWNIPLPYQIQFPLGIVLADLNNNNLPDILFPANNSIIYAIDGKAGTEIWASPLFGERFSGNPVVADLNGDKLPDVFICSRSGQVHIGFGKYGNPEWSTLQAEAEIRCTPSAGDVDNDGLPEAIVGTENGKILIYDGTKENFSQVFNVNEEFQKAKGSFFEDHQIRQRIAIGKLNSDDYADLVILTEQRHILALDGKDLKRLWFDEFESDLASSSLLPLALGDLNGDRKLEVVLATSDGKVIVYDGIGKGNTQKKINWGYVPETVEEFVTYPVLVDFDKDKNADVLIAGSYEGLYMFSGRDGKLITPTKPINNIDDLIIGTPLVADFSSDKKLDILLRRSSDNFYLLTTNSLVQARSILWGQINFNALQTGCNTYFTPSGFKFYVAIFLSLLAILFLIGYNVFTPIKRRNQFLKAV